MTGRVLLTGAVLAMLAGCAVRLGGPKPVEYRTLAFSTAGTTPPADVANWIRQAEANVVLLAAPADSAWFGEVARQADLALSGPGNAGSISLGFLASEPVGDTTVTLALPAGRGVVVHDALYKVDKDRYLDLLALRIGAGDPPRETVRALLRYVATDVMPQAAVVLAIDVPDAATGDSIAALVRPVFLDARECLRGAGDDPAPPVPGAAGMRLFYGPEARMRCESARLLGGAQASVVARLVVGR